MEHQSDGDANCNRNDRYSHQSIRKRPGRNGHKNTRGDNRNYSIIKICQNTMKCPGDLRRLTVTETPMKDYQLILVLKNLKRSKIIMINLRRLDVTQTSLKKHELELICLFFDGISIFMGYLMPNHFF